MMRTKNENEGDGGEKGGEFRSPTDEESDFLTTVLRTMVNDDNDDDDSERHGPSSSTMTADLVLDEEESDILAIREHFNNDTDVNKGDRTTTSTTSHEEATAVLWSLRWALLFIILQSFVPSEPHLYNFWIAEKNYTSSQVNNEIFPWSTYAQLAMVAVLGPLAHLVGYVPFIMSGAIGSMVCRILLIWGPEGMCHHIHNECTSSHLYTCIYVNITSCIHSNIILSTPSYQ